MFEKTWRAIRHNQGLALAIVICIGLGIWTYGCESKVASLNDSSRLVTRAELEVEIETVMSTAEIRLSNLDRQDAIKKKLIEFAISSAESGSVNKGGLVNLIGWILGAGLLVDNRRKDGVIKGKNSS